MANSQPTICIVTRRHPDELETFIRAHIEHLPGQPVVLHSVSQHGFGLITPLPIRLALKGLRVLARLSGPIGTISMGLARITDILVVSAFLRRQDVDVVLAEYGMMGVAIMDACIQAKVPLVVHFHGYDAYHAETILQHYHSAYQRMFIYATAVVAVSHDMQQQLETLGAPSEKIVYSPYGVDPALFAQAHPEASAPLFLAVGRFVDKKAPYLTILAFHKVVQAYPSARLIMIGDGPLAEACQQLIRALGIAQSVDLKGALPHEAVASHMQQARAFVQHSLRPVSGDSEGTPVAVLEAGMSGLPVVSTRHAGIKDVVIEDKTGFLVDEGDVDGMAKQMLILAQDAELAAQMGRQAREHVAAHFPMEQHIEKLRQILWNACTFDQDTEIFRSKAR
jgi:glycosyltransferase involved in cell wall biosynthesis